MTCYNETIHFALERAFHPRRTLIQTFRRLRRAWLKTGNRRMWARRQEYAGGISVVKIEQGKVTVARSDLE